MATHENEPAPGTDDPDKPDRPPVPPPGEDAGTRASINYRTTGTWGRGFSVSITITNESDQVIDDWALRLRYDEADVDQVWGARASGSGEAVTLRSAYWNEGIRPGGSASLGFTASGDDATLAGCTFNGRSCSLR